MKRYEKGCGRVFYRHHVGAGTYGGARFDLSVAVNSAGEVVGVPIIEWQNGPTIVVEVEDLIQTAYKAAFGEGE